MHIFRFWSYPNSLISMWENRENLFEEMLQEPDEVAMKRKHTRETLRVLQQAFRVCMFLYTLQPFTNGGRLVKHVWVWLSKLVFCMYNHCFASETERNTTFLPYFCRHWMNCLWKRSRSREVMIRPDYRKCMECQHHPCILPPVRMIHSPLLPRIPSRESHHIRGSFRCRYTAIQILMGMVDHSCPAFIQNLIYNNSPCA